MKKLITFDDDDLETIYTLFSHFDSKGGLIREEKELFLEMRKNRKYVDGKYVFCNP